MNLLENIRSLSPLKDPFLTDKVQDVCLHWQAPYSWQKHPRIWGYVTFQNGSTEGRQQFEATTFGELMSQIEVFLKSLPKS